MLTGYYNNVCIKIIYCRQTDNTIKELLFDRTQLIGCLRVFSAIYDGKRNISCVWPYSVTLAHKLQLLNTSLGFKHHGGFRFAFMLS